MEKARPLQLQVLPGRFAIHRFDPGQRVPEALLASPFFNVCWTCEAFFVVHDSDDRP